MKLPNQLTMPAVKTAFFPFVGGLDQVTPPIQLQNGKLRYCSNVEIGVNGGYTRVAGYERYSGQSRPSSAAYAILNVNLTGNVQVGHTVTNTAGTVSGKVVALGAGNAFLVLALMVGTFSSGMQLLVAATPVGTTTSPSIMNGGSTAALNALYLSLAANASRALIGPVPGTGPVLGVHLFNGKVYAFRNSITGATADMYIESPTGWTQVALGRTVRFTARTSTVAITIAAPGVVTWVAHGLAANQGVVFTTTGTLPTGIMPGVTYYVLAPTANTFTIAATPGGAAITTSGVQAGVHTATLLAPEIDEGSTITGKTSGATAIARRVLLTSGVWGTPVADGTIAFTSAVGTFQAGEALSIAGAGGLAVVNVAATDTAISLLPGGRFVFENWNFYGQASTLRAYFVDGKNPFIYEFDGVALAPIAIPGVTKPVSHLEIHKNALFAAVESSVFVSGPGTPYQFLPLYGGAEFTTGEPVTNLLSMPGSETGGALAIRTSNRTFVLYGNDTDDFNLIPYEKEAGAAPYTVQPIGGVLAFDTQGITSLLTTQKFGNFSSAMISELITPYMNDKVNMAVASCIVRRKNQYRLFFSGGESVFVSYAGNKMLGMTTIVYPHEVSCVSSREGGTGLEEIYMGFTDGYVRQGEIGTSFDGEAITWSALLAFNHFGGPRQLKRFRKAAIDVSGNGYAEFNFSTSLAYGSDEFANMIATTLAKGSAGGSFWDSIAWDQFYWDGQSLLPAEADITGTAENVSLIFSGSSDQYLPFTLSSAVTHFTPQRLLR